MLRGFWGVGAVFVFRDAGQGSEFAAPCTLIEAQEKSF